MDTSRDIHTDLMLAYGNPQTSPRHAAMLNRRPLVKLPTASGGVAKAGYDVVLSGYADFVYSRELQTQSGPRLDNLLGSLRAFPRPPQAKVLKGSVSIYSLENDLYRADYRIADGQVTVYNIQLVDRLQKQRDRMEKVALYRIKRNTHGFWEAGTKVDNVGTTYAAVNGQLNNLAKATWLMGSHLEKEFKNLQEYTLFHNPSEGFMDDTWESVRDKMGITTPTTRKFAKALADAQEKGNATKWVAHSQGGLIFAEAVRYLLNGSNSWSLNRLSFNGVRHPNKGTLLDKHSVSFHASATNNLRAKMLLERAGVKVISIRAHDFDFVPNILGMNTIRPRKLLGSVIHANHVLSGSLYQSPHTLWQTHEEWDHHMNNGPGKGRNGLQRAFERVDSKLRKSRPKSNYLP